MATKSSSVRKVAANAVASIEAGVLPSCAVSVACPLPPVSNPTSSLAKKIAASVAAMANSGGGVVVVGVVQGAESDTVIDDPNYQSAIYKPDGVIESCIEELRMKYYPPFEMSSGECDSVATPLCVQVAGRTIVVATAAAPGLVFHISALGAPKWRSGNICVPMELHRAHAALAQDTFVSLEALASAPSIAPPSSCMITTAIMRPESQFHENKAGILFDAPFDVLSVVDTWVQEYAYTLMNAATSDHPASLTIGVFDKSFRPCPLFFAPSTQYDDAVAIVRAAVEAAVRSSVLPLRSMSGITIELTAVAIHPGDLVPDNLAAGPHRPLLLQFSDFDQLTRAADKFLRNHDLNDGGKSSCLIPFWQDVAAIWPTNPLSMSNQTHMGTLWFAVSTGASARSIDILREKAGKQLPLDFDQLRPATAFIATISFNAADGTAISPRVGVAADFYVQRGFGAAAKKLDTLDVFLLSSARAAWTRKMESIVCGGTTLSLLVHGSSESPVAAAMRKLLPIALWYFDDYRSASIGDANCARRLPILAGLRNRLGNRALQIVADITGIVGSFQITAFIDDLVRLGVEGRQCVEETLLTLHLNDAWRAVHDTLSAWRARRPPGFIPTVEFRVHHSSDVCTMLFSRSFLVNDAIPSVLSPDLLPFAKKFLDGNTAAFTTSNLVRLPMSERVDFPRDNESVLVDVISNAIIAARPGNPKIVFVGKQWFGSGATTAAWRCAHEAGAKEVQCRVLVGMATLDGGISDALVAVVHDAMVRDAAPAAAPSALAVVIISRTAEQLTLDDIRRLFCGFSVRVIVVNVVARPVLPLSHNFGALLSVGEMKRGIDTYRRVFLDSELFWLRQLSSRIDLRVASDSGGAAATEGGGLPSHVDESTFYAASCSLLTLGLAARFSSFIPIQRVLARLCSLSDDMAWGRIDPGAARLILTVATLELFTCRPAHESGASNPVALVFADMFSTNEDVQLLLQQQPHRAYPVTLHPGFAPLLFQCAVNRVSPAHVAEHSIACRSADNRIITFLGETVRFLFSIGAFDAIDDLVLVGPLLRVGESPLVQGLIDLDDFGYAAIDFVTLLLQPGSVIAPNPLLDRPNIREYYILLSKLAHAASDDEALHAMVEGNCSVSAVNARTRALQLAILGVASAERAWKCVMGVDRPTDAGDTFSSIYDRASFCSSGIGVLDDATAVSEAKACINEHMSRLGVLEAFVKNYTTPNPPEALTIFVTVLLQVIKIRELAARQTYEYARVRSTRPCDSPRELAVALLDAQILSLFILQHLYALSDGFSKINELMSANQIFFRLAASPDAPRLSKLSCLYCFFSSEAAFLGRPAWPLFDDFIRERFESLDGVSVAPEGSTSSAATCKDDGRLPRLSLLLRQIASRIPISAALAFPPETEAETEARARAGASSGEP